MLEWDIINVKVNCLPKILNISINSLVLLLMAAAFYDLKESLDPTVRTRLMLLRVLSMSILPTSMELPRSCFFRQPEPPWCYKVVKVVIIKLVAFYIAINEMFQKWISIRLNENRSSSCDEQLKEWQFHSMCCLFKLKFDVEVEILSRRFKLKLEINFKEKIGKN